MALPIKDTPVLQGCDAERFINDIKANETRQISKTEYARMIKNYNQLIGITKQC